MISAKELENALAKIVEATKICASKPISKESKETLKKAVEILTMTTQLAFGFEGTINEIKEMLFQFLSGKNIMDEIIFAGSKYYQVHSNLYSNCNVCILFKGHDDSNSGIYFYSSEKSIIIVSVENISDEFKSSLDNLAKDMAEKGL